MLNISPFSCGLTIQQVFDNGSIYSPEVLDITEETLHSRFLEGVRNVASTDDTFPLAEKVKAFLADPSAFVAAATTAAPAAAEAPAKGEAKEELEELDEDMGFGL
ncbi:60S acidic ribosomal protein P0 [Myotis davidii]|uniref:Large ribosomal subunit protein uL10 n=1 Tax=Myotis davidii TaxID=225400 RepID=L5LSG8_MYODS|nr:60S acidic ribosomal protein P0 [Myotis davidii]